MWNRIAELWCKAMHSKAMWPMHGKYICPDCLREYPVLWEEGAAQPPAEPAQRANPRLVWSAKRSDTI